MAQVVVHTPSGQGGAGGWRESAVAAMGAAGADALAPGSYAPLSENQFSIALDHLRGAFGVRWTTSAELLQLMAAHNLSKDGLGLVEHYPRFSPRIHLARLRR